MKQTIAPGTAFLAGLLHLAGPPAAWSDTLAPGARVRITAAEAFTIAGIEVVQPDTRIFWNLKSSDDGTLTIVRPDGQGPIAFQGRRSGVSTFIG